VTPAVAVDPGLDRQRTSPRTRPPVLLVAGNPNSGKSTLFNALSGGRSKVSNYPGVTVTRLHASISIPEIGAAELVDLPGTYSLSARSHDEQVAVDAIIGLTSPRPDAVVVVTDATALARSLYLATEIIETGVPVVVALSMMDEARANHLTIDVHALSAALGAEVVEVVAPQNQGLDDLQAAIARAVVTGSRSLVPASYPAEAEAAVGELAAALHASWPGLSSRERRALAVWLLLSLDDDPEGQLSGIPQAIAEDVLRLRTAASTRGHNLDEQIIESRYARIDRLIERVLTTRKTGARTRTDYIDSVLTHRVGGVVVFALVMLALFQSLFTWSEPLIGSIEWLVTRTQDLTQGILPPGSFRDLIVNGVLAGVGNVIVFVPQIALLFLFIGLMEDVGYLARVAFVIDRVMARVGLHGRSFVPMLSGFSCAIPAVMATRTLESRTDRLLTMMVLPFMSCSARLPVYLLVIGTVFSGFAPVFGVLSVGALVLLAMYGLSVTAALTAAAVLRRTVFRGPRPTLMMELPPYRVPVVRVLLRNTWQQVRSFLVGAGTIILALSVVMWALLSYPRDPRVAASYEQQRGGIQANPSPGDRAALLEEIAGHERGAQLRNSVAGRVGRLIEPALQPLGFDWRIGIGILGAFAAREVFVSTMGMVFDISDADERNEPLREALQSARRQDGAPLMTPLTGVALMVFFVLACQCMSTLAVVRRETGTWGWPAFLFAYQTAVAYAVTLIVYQGGRLLGWV
jgi:ferrous iron transport protein B